MSNKVKKEILGHLLRVAKTAYTEGLCFNRHIYQDEVDRSWDKSNVKKEITKQIVEDLGSCDEWLD